MFCDHNLFIDKNTNTMKQKIRLTESQLHNIIRRCVNETVEEGFGDRVRGAVKGFQTGASEMSNQSRGCNDLISFLLYNIKQWRSQGVDSESMVNYIENYLKQESQNANK